MSFLLIKFHFMTISIDTMNNELDSLAIEVRY